VVSDSIVVLPFINMSADPEHEYFGDGITEEIINALAQIQQLQVVARSGRTKRRLAMAAVPMRHVSTFDATTASIEVKLIKPPSSSSASISAQPQTTTTDLIRRSHSSVYLTGAFGRRFEKNSS
jgi:hypothetical protein